MDRAQARTGAELERPAVAGLGMSEPIRTTLTQRGEALTMEFSPVSRDWYVSDCKRYAICVTHGEQVAGFKPFGAFIRPLNDAPDKDGHRPAAVNIDFFQ